MVSVAFVVRQGTAACTGPYDVEDVLGHVDSPITDVEVAPLRVVINNGPVQQHGEHVSVKE